MYGYNIYNIYTERGHVEYDRWGSLTLTPIMTAQQLYSPRWGLTQAHPNNGNCEVLFLLQLHILIKVGQVFVCLGVQHHSIQLHYFGSRLF